MFSHHLWCRSASKACREILYDGLPRPSVRRFRRPWKAIVLRAVVAAVTFILLASTVRAESVEYSRDIKRLLSNSCFACHGPDENVREADLRLDVRESAVDDIGAIVPGDADASEVIARLTTDDPDMKMPPEDSNRPVLTPEQIELMRRWINEGAKYQEHWAYVKLQRPLVPKVKRGGWVQNPIDAFIAQKHEEHGFNASPETDRQTLVRRLSFDLIGLPPSPEDVDASVNDKSPDAYEKIVAKVLASEHYGERMAAYWLDLVRYADSGGYHSDNPREVSMYRDYVIRAFNDNVPFDRFTVEQLAGDLLPDATWEQKVASGYNRLLQTTEEGGAQPKEYTAKYAADRVRNVGSVWLGTTLACTECHDHKYDPFTMKDFYSLAAFFADLQERPVGRQQQTPILTPAQAEEQRTLETEAAAAKKAFDTAAAGLTEAQTRWENTVKEKNAKDSGLPDNIAKIVRLPTDKRNDKQKADLAKHYHSVAPELEEVRKQLAERQRELDEFKKAIPTTLVSISGNPRTMRILPRGNWLDDSGEVVEPAVPETFVSLAVEDRRANRLDLAKWLVQPDNPLVARTMVNRLWKVCFGYGIARTLEDMGSQGEWPTHPELLDWLATEYIESGWDTKHMIQLMVTSAAYRQSSQATREDRRRDPSNKWLARQSRFRLDAEMVRDGALTVSGLLVREVGGRSVKPYQPTGYWAHLNFPARKWAKDHGDNVYRRGLYTHWQRTFLHPSHLAFDAPSREECTAERPRSNTPQQALVLLNDPTYVEAARVFAERIVREGGKADDERLAFAFRQALSRKPTSREQEILISLRKKHLGEYSEAKEAADQLLGIGDRPKPSDIDSAELAAWTSVARVILNLPESIIRY